MAGTTAAKVYGNNGLVIYTEDDLHHISAEYGVLSVAGPKFGIVLAPGEWTTVITENS